MGSTNGSSEQIESQNPRQKVLENFKEISRIMTQSFLMQKKIEKRYGKQSMPASEKERKKQEDNAS